MQNKVLMGPPGREFESEEFIVARCGLNRSDLATVVLQVNGHHFRFSSVQAFKNFVMVCGANAAEFERASRPKTKAELKAVN